MGEHDETPPEQTPEASQVFGSRENPILLGEAEDPYRDHGQAISGVGLPTRELRCGVVENIQILRMQVDINAARAERNIRTRELEDARRKMTQLEEQLREKSVAHDNERREWEDQHQRNEQEMHREASVMTQRT